ncbi:MAG: Gfo/Idh/MocA family oxidoreductase [Armatimonadota bacterium]|nr:Gfo/Idh/MocA family oxidoreductase [Armatimonadota bacterium]
MPDKEGNITFGVVGLGMGANRAQVVASTPGAKLVAVCDLREDRAKTVAERHGCDYYLDYEKMLERDDIDVVYVMTFSGLHAKHGIMAAQAGKHVISTKPLDVTLEAVDALIAECKKQGVKLVTDFDQRYSPNAQTIKNAVDSGALGRIILAEARLKWFRSQAYYDENGGWRGTWALDGGGSLSNQTVHFIDQLCWIVGDVKSVYAELSVMNHNIEGEDLGLAIINFTNGAKGAICGTTTFPRSLYAGVEIHGDRGAVLTTRGKDIEWVWAEGCETDPETLRVEPKVKNAVEDMIYAIKNNCEPQSSGEEGRKSVAVLEAIRKSNELGRPVQL